MSGASVPPAKLVKLQLRESAAIQGRGEVVVRWAILPPEDGSPIPLRTVAVREADAYPQPGVIWQRTWNVELPAGTRLLRMEERPEEPRTANPLALLERGAQGSRTRRQRRVFILRPEGKLEEVPTHLSQRRPE